jgi:hypothetical protein
MFWCIPLLLFISHQTSFNREQSWNKHLTFDAAVHANYECLFSSYNYQYHDRLKYSEISTNKPPRDH